MTVDQLAEALPNRIAIAVSGIDSSDDAQIIKDLSAVFADGYEFRRCRKPGGEPAFLGRLIESKFNTNCGGCSKPHPIGAACIWKKGEGVACLACGEPEEDR